MATQAQPSAQSASTPKSSKPPVKNLILDAGPLLSLTPLRGMAERFITSPSVFAELRDPRAREHWERLREAVGLEGAGVELREPDAISMAKVIAFSKATGDYAVLSRTDLQVIALTFMLEVEENGYARVRDEYGKPPKGTKPAHKLSKTASSAVEQPTTGSETKSSPSASASQLPPSEPLPSASAGPSSNPWTKNLPSSAEQVEDAEEEEDEDEVDELDEDDFPALRSGFEGVQLGGADGDAVEEVVQVEDQRQQDQRHKESADEATDPAEQIEANRPTLEESYRPSVGTSAAHASTSTTPLYAPEEPTTGNASDSDGEWITPGNVSHHKSLDLGLIPAAESSAQSSSNAADQKKKKVKGEKHIPQMKAACMTGDYAVQNVLLQMGLNLVGEQGKRIGVVKSWVLRCHACFKICKDSSKKFCPSCGNPTLIRASVSTQAPDAAKGSKNDAASTDNVRVHLKPNFQYRTRGTIYSIPQPKMGSAKGQSGGGSGLILREDQREFMTAVRREEGRRAKEERALAKAVKNEAEGKGKGLGGWNDPDWLPEMFTVGMSGKGRRGDEQLPDVGYGRRNPNQARRKRK